jgi:hypothetical protein
VQCLSGTTVDTRVVIDGELPGQPFFYTYHPAMSCDPGDSCANYADPQAICDGCADRGLPCDMGLECCWGENLDIDDPSVSLVADTWYAVETMVVANTPGVADGEMTLSIDGVQIGHHDGILWREDPTLQLNHFIVWNYFPETEVAHRIWFDDLVISTAPIGVLGGGASDTSGGDGSGGMTSDTASSTDAGDASAGMSATTTASDTATTDPSGGTTSAETTGTAAESDDAAGCGCRANGTPYASAWLLALGGFVCRRRS